MSILSAATSVLRCFSSSRHDVTVTDLVTLLGIPKSNASRLLRAMRDEGLLETVGDSKRYRPSLLLNQVGQIYRFAASLIDRADAVVARISDQIGHTGYISMRRGNEIVGVTAHPGRHALRVVTTIGERIPAFASSTGRALLARLSDDEVNALYPAGFTAPSKTAPQDLEDLLARLAAVRRSGFAESHDEAVRGVRAISVAVGDPATGDEVALCIAFPAATAEQAERLAIIRSLGEGAAEIARLTQDERFIPLNLPIAETVP
jgi:DNA-binding IclR family transcriptional regulator